MMRNEEKIIEDAKAEFFRCFGFCAYSAEIVEQSGDKYVVILGRSDGQYNFESEITIEFAEKSQGD